MNFNESAIVGTIMLAIGVYIGFYLGQDITWKKRFH